MVWTNARIGRSPCTLSITIPFEDKHRYLRSHTDARSLLSPQVSQKDALIAISLPSNAVPSHFSVSFTCDGTSMQWIHAETLTIECGSPHRVAATLAEVVSPAWVSLQHDGGMHVQTAAY